MDNTVCFLKVAVNLETQGKDIFHTDIQSIVEGFTRAMMFVVSPLLCVTIDWQEMEGSTYLATLLLLPTQQSQ